MKAKQVAVLSLIFLGVATSAAIAEEPETVESFLAATRIELVANISSGAQGEFVRESLLEVGLAEIDAEKVVDAWARGAAECFVARMREQLVGNDTDDEAMQVEMLRGLLENKNAVQVETEHCMYKTPVNTDTSVLGPGWYQRANE